MAWRFINFQRNNAYENMAIDEAIFRETINNNQSPTIRFYGWQPAAVSIGYFQDVTKEVNLEKCRKAGVNIIRRPSGGKAVFHDAEITYSVIAGKEERIFPADILGTYKIISQCIVRGLAFMGINAVLSENSRTGHDVDFKSCCFSLPSRNELLVAGRKICGSAQMRTAGGFLQHGSLLLNFDAARTAACLLPERSPEQLFRLRDSVTAINEELAIPVDEREICTNLKKGFTDILGVEIAAETMSPAEEALKNELIHKYADPCWNNEGRKELLKIGDGT